MVKILSVATAGLKPDQIGDTDHVNYPRVDYLELDKLLKINTVDYTVYENSRFGHIFRNIETQIRSDIYLASLSYLRSRKHDIVFTWSERAGIPLAGFRRLSSNQTKFVTMFKCWSKRQERVITNLKLFSTMDAIIVHCDSMRRRLISLGAPADKIHLIYFCIDQEFFSLENKEYPKSKTIMSIGEPRSRDYPSLIEAIQGLPIEMEIAASGHWYAREKQGSVPENLPGNVTIVRRIPRKQLKEMYARSQFVVLPLLNEVYSAGATAILEANSMERAVIATRSQGIVEYVVDGETGILVEPGDPQAMRDAIEYLLVDPEEARRMGENARQRIEEKLNLESFINQLASLLDGVSKSA